MPSLAGTGLSAATPSLSLAEEGMARSVISDSQRDGLASQPTEDHDAVERSLACPADSPPDSFSAPPELSPRLAATSNDAAATQHSQERHCETSEQTRAHDGPTRGDNLAEAGLDSDDEKSQPRHTATDTNYEQKYAPDAYGEELSARARVWRVYNDESQIADGEMVTGLNGTLDVLLVFVRPILPLSARKITYGG